MEKIKKIIESSIIPTHDFKKFHEKTHHKNSNTTGWWLSHLPLWKMMEWVRQLGWHDLPNWMESHEIPWFQTTNQYLIIIIPLLTISSPYHHQIITIINHIPWFQSPPIRLCGCCLKYPRWPLIPFRSCIRRPLDQQKPSLGPRSSLKPISWWL